jgi:DNA-binding CsgD family transcriptional regulator
MKPLTVNQLRAAQLVAEDRLTNTEIAKKCKVARRTVDNWKKLAAFRAEVQRIQRAAEQQVVECAVSDKKRRVAQLNADWLALDRIQKEQAAFLRAVEKKHKIVIAGASTGLVTERVTTAGTEYRLNTALLRARLAIQEEVARELGQRIDKSARALVRSVEDLSDDELDAMVKDGERRFGAEAVRR